MSNLPISADYFSGGRRLTAADNSEGGVPLFGLINASGQAFESAAAGATLDYSALTAEQVKAASRGITKNTGGAITITLPDFGDAPDGWERTFLALDGGTNTLTVNRAGTDTINGGTSVALDSNGGWCRVVKVPGDTEWTALVALS